MTTAARPTWAPARVETRRNEPGPLDPAKFSDAPLVYDPNRVATVRNNWKDSEARGRGGWESIRANPPAWGTNSVEL